jgi:hypothetical protein
MIAPLGVRAMANGQFILYQEHDHDYSAHCLVPAMKAKALPTRVVTFHPATEKELGEIHKKVKEGYKAWLVPTYGDALCSMPADLILYHCDLLITAKLAKKIV